MHDDRLRLMRSQVFVWIASESECPGFSTPASISSYQRRFEHKREPMAATPHPSLVAFDRSNGGKPALWRRRCMEARAEQRAPGGFRSRTDFGDYGVRLVQV